MTRKILFLDRDGVINEKAAEHCYIRSWEEFHFLPGVIDAVRQFYEAGFEIFIITNQQGIAKGAMSQRDVDEIHRKMVQAMAEKGAFVSGVMVCPHLAGSCHCRKPEIGLFLQVEEQVTVDKKNSWMIGDSKSDIQAGIRYGIPTCLIGQGEFHQTLRAKNLSEAFQKICGGE